ncbi:ATP-binding protein [Flavobacteriaceae bacterium SZ-1-7]|uniref:ATP-binding protein n=1 Tax=Tamlana sedimenti TaxID=3134126 RepID=UPI00312AFE89
MENISFVQELVKKANEFNVKFFRDFDSESILRYICGFLNTEGGWIIVGHTGKEPTYINGLSNDSVVLLKREVNSRISPQSLVYIAYDSDEEENNFVLINILKGSRQPYTLDKVFYIIEDNVAKKADQDDISIMLRSSNEYSSTWEKSTALDCGLEDLNKHEIQKTIREANKVSKGNVLPEDEEGFLNYFQLIDYGSVKNGAVVLFAEEPIKFLPQCRIRISVLPEGKTGDIITDMHLIEDNLFVAFMKVQDYFSLHNPLVSQFDNSSWSRNSELKFPSEALDEAIVNAMVHRDYSDISGEITINIYKDKMEIINSGEIPEDIVKGKSKIRPHHSVLRNPTIAHMFYLRGKMEKLGRGLTLIRDQFVNSGYRKPEWTFQSGYTTLTLFSEPLVLELNERMYAYLNSLNTNTFSRKDYEVFFDFKISEKTARNDLSKLVEAGYLSQKGKGSNTSYIRLEKEII